MNAGRIAEIVLVWALMLAGGCTLTSWLVTVPWPARAQSGARGDGHDQHHDWYRGLLTPQGYSCCNAGTEDKPGEWQPVPTERILPDQLNRVPLHAHICEQDGYVRCFLRGGGGT